MMKCKNLGIVINASDMDLETLDALYTIYSKVEDVQSKQRSRTHGK